MQSVVLTVAFYMMSAVYTVHAKQEGRRKKEDGEMGSFLKHQKI